MKLSDIVACVRGGASSMKPISAGPTEPLSAVAQRMLEHNVGAVVIVERQKPVGIITDRDLALALGARGVATQAPVKSVMSTPVRTVPEGAGIFAATQCMRDVGVRRLAVVDNDGCLVGIVSMDDLLRLLGGELHNLAEGIHREVAVR